jgi:hypothetical protein
MHGGKIPDQQSQSKYSQDVSHGVDSRLLIEIAEIVANLK